LELLNFELADQVESERADLVGLERVPLGGLEVTSGVGHERQATVLTK
jgi:hypothetical protein